MTTGPKLYEPTRKRLDRARREGDSGMSTALARGAALIAVALMAPPTLRTLCRYAMQSWRDAFRLIGGGGVATGIPIRAFAIDIVRLSAPTLLLAAAVGAAVQLVQARGVRITRRVPWGQRRLWVAPWGWDRVGVTLLGTVAVGVFTGGAVFELPLTAANIDKLSGRLEYAVPVIEMTIQSLVVAACVISIGIALIDVCARHKARRSRLRMSRYEIEQEHREQGDHVSRRPPS